MSPPIFSLFPSKPLLSVDYTDLFFSCKFRLFSAQGNLPAIFPPALFKLFFFDRVPPMNDSFPLTFYRPPLWLFEYRILVSQQICVLLNPFSPNHSQTWFLVSPKPFSIHGKDFFKEFAFPSFYPAIYLPRISFLFPYFPEGYAHFFSNSKCSESTQTEPLPFGHLQKMIPLFFPFS